MNLINIVKGNEISKSYWKIFLLAVLSIIFALLFSYSLKSASTDYLYLMLISGGSFFILAILQSILIRNLAVILTINLFNGLALFSSFWQYFSYIFLGAFILCFCFLVWAGVWGKREQKLLIKVNYFRITRQTSSKILTAVALLGAFVLYLYFSGQLTPPGFVSPEKLFQKAVAPADKIINKFYPGFEFSLTVNEFLRMTALKQVQESPNFSALPKEIKDKVLNQGISELKSQIIELTGSKIPDSYFEKRVDDFIYNVLATRITQLPENYQKSAMIGLVIAGFLIMRSIIIPVGWLINLLGFLVFKFLIAMRFASIATETIERETIVLN